MEVCIIGAGLAGVCAARHSLANGFKTTIFEQTGAIGGTWVYNENIDKDEYGLDIPGSMYKSVVTNFPKEIMGFPDFDFSEQDKSYVPAEDVLQFIRDYAGHFKVKDHIKFHHYVVRARPYQGKWEVFVKDLPNDKYSTYWFDYLFICNGHHEVPSYPKIKGLENFSGEAMHSRYYREPSKYSDDIVLIIGAGYSGKDIAEEISQVAKKVLVSHREKKIQGAFSSDTVIQKPDVVGLHEGNIAEFADGSKDQITKILYCTGFNYSFPFLSMDSGVTIVDNHVRPLYKHCISINSPNLAFIGLCFRSMISNMIDLQVRFVLTYFTGKKSLPSRRDMLADMEEDLRKRELRGLPLRKGHMLATEQRAYYNDLCETAGIDNLKPVLMKLYLENQRNLEKSYLSFRNHSFRILDDEEFVEVN